MLKNKHENLFYHEDDYLQVEIISKSNIFEQQKSLDDLEYNFSEYGFSNINFRHKKKIPTSSLKIKPNELKAHLKEYSLIEFNNVYHGYSSNPILKKNTISFGFEDYAILFDFEKETVKNIWMVFNPKLKLPFHSYSNLLNALFLLGNKYDMILIDWNEEKIVNLSHKQEMQSYL
ncbi:hypothetical protein CFS9_39220 [Flavobacterium sp. CFS9]|uniref:Uncharacterized protein n=1 Tax=Flavobacterium sp. CFS9 TaxID=3143118 RepID=A0AAT9H734_9FLAO